MVPLVLACVRCLQLMVKCWIKGLTYLSETFVKSKLLLSFMLYFTAHQEHGASTCLTQLLCNIRVKVVRGSGFDFTLCFFFHKAVRVGDFPRLKFDLLMLNTICLTKSIRLPVLVFTARLLVKLSLWVCEKALIIYTVLASFKTTERML